jgi:serine protease Do
MVSRLTATKAVSVANAHVLTAPALSSQLVALPSIAPVVKKAKSAVVNIVTIKTSPQVYVDSTKQNQVPLPPEDFLDDFFSPQSPEENPREPETSPPNLAQPPKPFREVVQASGFIFDKEGHVITNNHVVEGADKILVKLDDGTEIKASIVGRDPKTDLALLKLQKPGDYPSLILGDSDQVEIGDWVLAIGNPFGLNRTVTKGIVSARGRAIGAGPYDDFLQTDASINPGNSGGPLLTLNGEVVGVNALVFSGSSGIGFAIPSKIVAKVVERLKKFGFVERGYIGAVVQPLTDELVAAFGLKNRQGALVGEALVNSPAQTAGIKPGDVIVEFAGRSIQEIDQLSTITAETPVGQEIQVAVIRDQKKLSITLTVGRLDDAIPDNGGDLLGDSMDLGLTLREISPTAAEKLGLETDNGLLVEQTQASSPAQEAGIQVRDVILEVDRKPVNSLGDYNWALRSHPRGEPVLLWVRRGDTTIYQSINLALNRAPIKKDGALD